MRQCKFYKNKSNWEKKKRKIPKIFIAEARKKVTQSFNPNELQLISSMIWSLLKSSLNLGRPIVEFVLICTISKIHKLKVCWSRSLPFFSGVLSMEYEMDWAKSEPRNLIYLRKISGKRYFLIKYKIKICPTKIHFLFNFNITTLHFICPMCVFTSS